MRLKGEKPIFSHKDTHSLDATLSPIIATGLKKFLKTIKGHSNDSENDSFGIPSSMFCDSKTDYSAEEYKDATAKWYKIINEMIYAFDEEKPPLPDNTLEMIPVSNPNKNGYYALSMNVLDKDGYDGHQEEQKAHHQKVDSGLSLFAEHYNDLWW